MLLTFFSALFYFQLMLAQSLKFVPVFVPMGTTANVGFLGAQIAFVRVTRGNVLSKLYEKR